MRMAIKGCDGVRDEICDLQLIDLEDGVDYARHFIGSTGAFVDGQFEWG